MSLAQGNNTSTRPRIEPGSPDTESDALTTRPVRPPSTKVLTMICTFFVSDAKSRFLHEKADLSVNHIVLKLLEFDISLSLEEKAVGQ